MAKKKKIKRTWTMDDGRACMKRIVELEDRCDKLEKLFKGVGVALWRAQPLVMR